MTREQLTEIEAKAKGGSDPRSEPASDNPCDGKRSSAGLVIELRPNTADRLRTAAERNGSTPASVVEKALQVWLRRDEYRAVRTAAREHARLVLERLRAEGRLNPPWPGQPRNQEGIPR